MYTRADFIVLPHWEKQATGTRTCYPIQSHYAHTEPTSPWPNNAECQAMKATSINFKVIVQPAWSRFEPAMFGFPDLPAWETDALLIRPSRLLWISIYIILFGDFLLQTFLFSPRAAPDVYSNGIRGSSLSAGPAGRRGKWGSYFWGTELSNVISAVW